jgi:hypothetical protein
VNVRLLSTIAALAAAGVAAASAGGHPNALSRVNTPTGAVPAGQWVSLGPTLIQAPEKTFEDGSTGQFNATGRLVTMAVDPSDPKTIYVGSPGATGVDGSGVWKTTDGGTSWTPIADDLPSLAVDAIALDPTNPDRVYVVLYQYGLYRSDDAGSTWTHVYDGDLHVRTDIGPDGNRTVLLINPHDPSELYLTSDLGVLRSKDGGYSWPVSLGKGGATSVEGGATALVMDPQDPKVLYAAMSNPAFDPGGASYRTQGAYKTVNGGDHWDPMEQLPAGEMPWRNILLTITHPAGAAHETVYAMFPRGPIIDNDGGLFGGIGYDLYRTIDGETWSKQFSCFPDPEDHWKSYYNCSFAVMTANPAEPDTVYLGGADLFLSFDGGKTFKPVPLDPNKRNFQPYAPHVDYWQLVTDPSNPAYLYATSDGGIYKSTNHGQDKEGYGKEGTWDFIGEGIANTEMHDLALVKMSNGAMRATAATADNGSILSDETPDWHQFAGGDGGAVAIDPIDPNRLYLSYNEGSVNQKYYPDPGDPQPFLGCQDQACLPDHVIPADVWQRCHAYDQTFQLLIYPSREPVSKPVFDACGSLWRTTQITPPGDWSPIFTPPKPDAVVRVAIDPSSNIYYAGTRFGRVYAGLGGADWTQVFPHPTSLKLSDIEVDRAHPGTLYASFGPPIWIDDNCSQNAGGPGNPDGSRIYRLQRESTDPLKFNYKDITYEFPKGLCVIALAVDPRIPRTVYAATDKGMYRGRSNATGGPWVWEKYDNGMPPAGVRDLEVDSDTGQLYAGTSGRGAFKVTLETILPVSIDIKPGTSENTLNIKSSGKIPVAILSSTVFDAPNEVDETSLTFGRTGEEASLDSCDAGREDFNGDGLPDLVCHFHTSLTGFQAGDTEGFLKGLTTEGVPIEGSDAVKILSQ